MSGHPLALRVLIVEDRPDDAEIMAHGLSEAGYDVSWVRVDTEADYLAALHEGLDVILADYDVPSFEALRALTLLQERSLEIPFIIVSGTLSEEAAVDCLKQGAADYLLKDRLHRLPPAVAQAMEQCRLREANRRAEEELRETARGLAEANEALRRADELKDHFVAVTAHELRTPITSVLGYAQLLRSQWGTLEPEERLDCCATIERQARVLSGMVEDLLTLCALEGGAVGFDLEPLSARAAAE